MPDEEILNQLIKSYDQRIKALKDKFKSEIKAKDEQIKMQENHIEHLREMNIILAKKANINIIENKSTLQSNMLEAPKYNLNNAKFGGGFSGDEGATIGGTLNDYSLTDVAKTAKHNSTSVKTILILGSNPKTTTPLRLDEEVREIDVGLERARKREQFDLKQRWAVRVQDVYQALLDFKPQYVHFSGHGSGDDGLVLEDEIGNVRLVETVALASLFKLFASDIECVVLNACYSEVQAIVIAQHIPYVIGMNKAIGDKAAIKFATGGVST